MKAEKLNEAWRIFLERAERENRNYFGDLVKDNLNNLIGQGYNPQQAVDKLFEKANKVKR